MRQRNSNSVYKNWGIDMGKSEMFGPAKAFTKKYLKGMDYKRRGWQLCSVFLTVCILVFVFSVSPKHLDIRLPEDKDLLGTPMLRGQETAFDFEENRFFKERVVDFMEESCEQFKDSYDIIFCHNVVVNEEPFAEPCFMLCKQKEFYANVKVSMTEDSKTIVCTETYATTKQQVKREQYVVLSGERHVKQEEGTGGMEAFTKIPKSGIDICLFQHAVAILSGKWIQ